MANTKFYWPDDDDPLFSGAIVVYSPIQPTPTPETEAEAEAVEPAETG